MLKTIIYVNCYVSDSKDKVAHLIYEVVNKFI